MTYRVTGRATPFEDRILKNQDRKALGLPPLPKKPRAIPQKRALCVRPVPIEYTMKPYVIRTNEEFDGLFTREYVPKFCQPKLGEVERSADNDNDWKHDWPAFDQAMAGTLIAGRNDDGTSLLNITAVWLLREIRRLTELVEKQTRHNHTGFFDGFNHDSLSDLGPTPEMIISKFVGSDVQPAAGGKKPKSVPRIDSKTVLAAWKNRSSAVVEDNWPVGECEIKQKEVLAGRIAYQGGFKGLPIFAKYLRSAGDLQFNELSQMTKFCVGVDRQGEKIWLKFLDRTRASKGTNEDRKHQREIKTQANERDAERNNYLVGPSMVNAANVEFLAGKSEPTDGKPKAKQDDRTFKSTHPAYEDEYEKEDSYLQSPHDPVVAYQLDERDQGYAADELDRYRRIMTGIPFYAFQDAAMGMRLDECGGGPRHNKQASARGRDRIKIAVTNFIEAEFDIEPMYIEVAA